MNLDTLDLFSVPLTEKLNGGSGSGGSNTTLNQLISCTITSITIPTDATKINERN